MLNERIELHRQALITALDEAAKYGVAASTLERPYYVDSNDLAINIPRSVLNRVIMTSLQLELDTTERYFFCSDGCERSLERDLADHPEAVKATQLIRAGWVRIKYGFIELVRDVSIGVWARATHKVNYARSIANSIRYQRKAYGNVSIAAGAAAFGVAFGATEAAESVALGPLHLACQANYFWSLAIGSWTASLSRNVRALLLFGSNERSFLTRVFDSVRAARAMRAFRKVQNRILLGDTGAGVSPEKVSRKAAYTGALHDVLAENSARSTVAADPLLWSELVVKEHITLFGGLGLGDKEILFGNEIDRIFELKGKYGLGLWMDLHASLRTILALGRRNLTARHILAAGHGPAILALGTLDKELQNIDVTVQRLLMQRGREASLAPWLRETVQTWMRLAFETLTPEFNAIEHASKVGTMHVQIERVIRAGQTASSCEGAFVAFP